MSRDNVIGFSEYNAIDDILLSHRALIRKSYKCWPTMTPSLLHGRFLVLTVAYLSNTFPLKVECEENNVARAQEITFKIWASTKLISPFSLEYIG